MKTSTNRPRPLPASLVVTLSCTPAQTNQLTTLVLVRVLVRVRARARAQRECIKMCLAELSSTKCACWSSQVPYVRGTHINTVDVQANLHWCNLTYLMAFKARQNGTTNDARKTGEFIWKKRSATSALMNTRTKKKD